MHDDVGVAEASVSDYERGVTLFSFDRQLPRWRYRVALEAHVRDSSRGDSCFCFAFAFLAVIPAGNLLLLRSLRPPSIGELVLVDLKNHRLDSTDRRLNGEVHRGPELLQQVVLLSKFMEPLGLTSSRLAKELGVPLPRVHDVVLGKRPFRPIPRFGLASFVTYLHSSG